MACNQECIEKKEEERKEKERRKKKEKKKKKERRKRRRKERRKKKKKWKEGKPAQFCVVLITFSPPLNLILGIEPL